jgi:simple sugar transport system substrate-binding protein
MLAQGVDALIVVPMEVPPMEPILKQAMKSGVVVITHEASKVTNAVYDIEAFDNAKYGENLMKNLADRTGKTGQYAMSVGSLNSTAQVEWMDAAVAYQKKNYPNMKLVGDYLISESNIDKSYSEAKQTLQRYPNLVGFIGGDAGDVLGAGRAVLEAGLKDKVTVLGTSIVSYAGPLMKSGAIKMISTWDPAQAGYVANLVALKVIQGKKISTGDDLGVDGFHKVTVKGKVIYGDAWVEITLKNMADYNF